MPLPTTLYTASQTRELDQLAIEEFGIKGFVLMQRAGQATFEIIRKAFPKANSFCVICGSGNNGGDGYVIATLAKKAGFDVKLVQLGDEKTISGDALLAKVAFEKVGGLATDFNKKQLKADIIIDAIFGTGLTREVKGHWADAIEAINNRKTQSKVIAVDVPSGLNADTGRVLGCCIKADITVTYIGVKCGLVTAQAREYVGELAFDDLQIPADVYKNFFERSNKKIISKTILQDLLRPRQKCCHKGNFGHALLIGGVAGMSGAIKLAGEACLRTGAGLVRIATDPSHSNYINLNRPELMVSAVEQVAALSPLMDKASVIAIGPGLSQSDWAKDLFERVIKTKKPLLLDADALNILANTAHSSNNWILTPHPAEAARLLSISTEQVSISTDEVEHDRYKAVVDIQKKYGGVCVLKGAGTLVSNGSETYVCTAGNPGMASGGMGDVLSGIITGLLAQGLSLFDAAKAGVQLHAQAADLASVEDGERGLLASDLFPFIKILINK